MIQYKPRKSYRYLTHEEAVDAVRAYHERGESQSAIAKRLGASQASIACIVHGTTHPDAFAEVFPDMNKP